MTGAAAATLRTLVPLAADGVGPSRTCARLVDGIFSAGGRVDMMVTRVRREHCRAPLLSALPGPLSLLPYKTVSPLAIKLLERWYSNRIGPGDVAWLWPNVSLKIHEEIAARGIPIVLEGINSRMATARAILDEAYDAFGAPPAHGITDARIAEEEAKLALATTIFAPNALVEESLQGTALAESFLPSSYGMDTSLPRPARKRPVPTGPDDPVRFMFCGYACVRKGVHYLLDLWRDMPPTATLRLVGAIEPIIAERYADLLASDRVETTGFARDVAQQYVDADVFVFPSLEEGGPQVCYEAAHFGLPSVTSSVGGGRIVAGQGTGTIVDPADLDAFRAALMEMLENPDMRAEIGERARAAAPLYDWDVVGADRLEKLQARFPGLGPA